MGSHIVSSRGGTQDHIRKCGIILIINDEGLISRADMMPLEFCEKF